MTLKELRDILNALNETQLKNVATFYISGYNYSIRFDPEVGTFVKGT